MKVRRIDIYSDFWVGRKRQTFCFAELNQKYRDGSDSV